MKIWAEDGISEWCSSVTVRLYLKSGGQGMTTSDCTFITVLLCNLVKIRQDVGSLVIIFIHLPTNEVQVYGGASCFGFGFQLGWFLSPRQRFLEETWAGGESWEVGLNYLESFSACVKWHSCCSEKHMDQKHIQQIEGRETQRKKSAR